MVIENKCITYSNCDNNSDYIIVAATITSSTDRVIGSDLNNEAVKL